MPTATARRRAASPSAMVPLLLRAAAVALLGAGLLVAKLLAQDAPIAPARVSPVVQVVQGVGPAVVNVYQQAETELPFPFNQFAPGERTTRSSLGSGVLIDAEGYIVTNAHVLPLGSEGIHVSLWDGSSLPATLVSIDLENDVALLKVEPEPGQVLAAARLGTSSDLLVGETVIAIGNPLGRENSVSTGIVSSLYRSVRVATPGRPGQLSPRFTDYIQIDAPINPGNSGGPVLNIEGDVIGIMFAMQTEAQGMGFAIPVDRVRRSLTSNLLNPRLRSEVVTGFELEGGPSGRDLTLAAIEPDGPAARAGLREGDRLLELLGTPLAWEFDVNKALASSQPGDHVPVVVGRGAGELRAELVLDRGESPLLHLWRRLGVQIVDHSRFKGVRVQAVDPTGPAATLGLQQGDLIDGVGECLLDTTDDLYDSVHGLPSGARVVVHVWRGREAWVGPLVLR